MIQCTRALQSIDMGNGAISNLLVLRNSIGHELEIILSSQDMQRVMGLLQAEDERVSAPSDGPSLSDEEIAMIQAHRNRGTTLAPPPPNTEEMADRLMRGDDPGDLFAEESPLSTPFTP